MYFSITKFSKSPSGRIYTIMYHNLKKYICTDIKHYIETYPYIYIFSTTSSPFTNFLLLYPKTAPCPEAAAQTTTIAAANHCKAFPKPLRARF
jgi:hypothetical protein